MGGLNAERTLRTAFEHALPQVVFSSGFAGALHPELRVGSLIFDASRTRPGRAEQLRNLGARPATFHCSQRVVITASEKRDLYFSSGCDAIEMESKTISDLCAARGIECITLRAISDVAHEELPLDFNALMTPDKRLSSVRLALALAMAPQKIPALWQLGKNSACAAAQLARALSALVGP
jgi:nucleoside phosphorylase